MLSLVMVNWNGEAFLEGFLQSLVRQSYTDFRLHVVDNGSTDGSRAILEGFAQKLDLDLLCLQENRGFAEANNLGIEGAMGDLSEWIVTLNNDLELAGDCLEALTKAMADYPGAGFFQILMINYYDRDFIDAAGIDFTPDWGARQRAYKLPLSRLDEVDLEPPAPCAGAAAYRKDALLKVREATGYFDKRFFAYSEDVDLGLRLKAAGITGRLVKDALVYHVHSGTGGRDTAFKIYYLTRNRYLYLWKNLEAREFARARKVYLREDRINWVKSLLRGRAKTTVAGIKGYRDFRKLMASTSRHHETE